MKNKTTTTKNRKQKTKQTNPGTAIFSSSLHYAVHIPTPYLFGLQISLKVLSSGVKIKYTLEMFNANLLSLLALSIARGRIETNECLFVYVFCFLFLLEVNQHSKMQRSNHMLNTRLNFTQKANDNSSFLCKALKDIYLLFESDA